MTTTITIKHEINFTPEAAAILQRILSGATAPAPEPVNPNQMTLPIAAPEPVSQFPHEPAADVQAPTYTLEEVRAVAVTKSKAGHKEAIKALLQKFGAETVPTLSKDHYTEFVDAVNAL